MIICLKRQVGGLVAADHPLNRPHLIECDGRRVRREEYPDLCGSAAAMRVPDLRGTLPGAWFYLIGR